eukprot:1503146-Amphidinium_carterae.2
MVKHQWLRRIAEMSLHAAGMRLLGVHAVEDVGRAQVLARESCHAVTLQVLCSSGFDADCAHLARPVDQQRCSGQHNIKSRLKETLTPRSSTLK